MSLNLETAKALVLAEIEKEGEDYVYKQYERDHDGPALCLNYEYDGTPSCLVGRALDAGGIITFEMLKNYRNDREDILGTGIYNLNRSLELEIDPAALAFLFDLQNAQDDGTAWGEAYRKATLWLDS